ncbi:MAG: hypothetical protein IJA75_04070 [Oscillospiraceae bacterium]|nr:hypothetical protein [Oscillospiraceae bacterium]
MATKTTQYEASAISAANRELEQALQELDDKIREYQQFGSNLTEELQDYRDARRRWLI